METFLLAMTILNEFNKNAPGIASFIGVVRGADGKITVTAIQDDTDTTGHSVLDAIAKWRADNGK